MTLKTGGMAAQKFSFDMTEINYIFKCFKVEIVILIVIIFHK